jgi:hypothetical protein
MAAKVLIEGSSAPLSDMGDVSCQGKVTSLPQASLLPMSVDRNATGSPILRGGSVTHVSDLDPLDGR